MKRRKEDLVREILKESHKSRQGKKIKKLKDRRKG